VTEPGIPIYLKKNSVSFNLNNTLPVHTLQNITADTTKYNKLVHLMAVGMYRNETSN
jgi:hypothetical protein